MRIHTQSLKFVKFKKEYFEEYNRWFQNETIRDALYEIDDEWLECVLSEDEGVEYAIFIENDMIAVVGITLPKENNATYVITNIAVNPSKFGQGIGSLVLGELLKKYPLKKSESWVAFVEQKNVVAQKFFSKNGWIQVVDPNEEEDLLRYEKRRL